MNHLTQAFDFGGVSVRTITRDSVTWFVATDVCAALEIQNPSKALTRLEPEERSNFKIGRQGIANLINESGLYALVLSSRKPAARQFRRWVTGEVLPAIRKTGQYQADWRKLRHEAASSYKVMGAVLQMVRQEAGKATASHHYSNEARLINSLLAGEYRSLDRESLSASELGLLAHLEERNAVLIGRGLDYAGRKSMLAQYAADWRLAHGVELLSAATKEPSNA